METLLTTEEVAAILKMSRRTVENWRSLGKGPPWRRIEGLVRYPESELYSWALGEGKVEVEIIHPEEAK